MLSLTPRVVAIISDEAQQRAHVKRPSDDLFVLFEYGRAGLNNNGSIFGLTAQIWLARASSERCKSPANFRWTSNNLSSWRFTCQAPVVESSSNSKALSLWTLGLFGRSSMVPVDTAGTICRWHLPLPVMQTTSLWTENCRAFCLLACKVSGSSTGMISNERFTYCYLWSVAKTIGLSAIRNCTLIFPDLAGGCQCCDGLKFFSTVSYHYLTHPCEIGWDLGLNANMLWYAAHRYTNIFTTAWWKRARLLYAVYEIYIQT